MIAMLRRCALVLLLTLAAAPAFAQKASDPAPLQFRDTAEAQRFHDLVAELRCVMCQNQSLAEITMADIAVDLRHEVLALMREGRSDAEVRDFLVARYGEFVLYRPRVSSTTWLLWFGPLLFALGGGVVIWRLLRRALQSAALRSTTRRSGDVLFPHLRAGLCARDPAGLRAPSCCRCGGSEGRPRCC